MKEGMMVYEKQFNAKHELISFKRYFVKAKAAPKAKPARAKAKKK